MKPKTLNTINKKQTFVVTGGLEFLWQVFGLREVVDGKVLNQGEGSDFSCVWCSFGSQFIFCDAQCIISKPDSSTPVIVLVLGLVY